MDKINEISRKYGEMTMRMAITHLIDKGMDAFRNVDIEKVCKKAIEETPKNSLITGELQAEILRCCKELSDEDIWDILRYVQASLSIDGIYTQIGQCIRFLQNATGNHIVTYLAANDTTEEQIDNASKRLDDLVEDYGKTHKGDYWKIDLDELIVKAFSENNVTLREPTYHKTIYV